MPAPVQVQAFFTIYENNQLFCKLRCHFIGRIYHVS